MGNIETKRKFSRLTRCSIKKLLLKVSQYSQENNCLESLFNKVAGLQFCKFIEERHQRRCSSMHTANFLRASILKNICIRLLLIILLLLILLLLLIVLIIIIISLIIINISMIIILTFLFHLH